MKTNKRFMIGIYLLACLAFLSPGSSDAADTAVFSPGAWVGLWTVVEDPLPNPSGGPNSEATVEIQPTADGKGIEIIHEILQQPEDKEVVIPDGTRQPLKGKMCSGWQVSEWLPKTGAIVGSSEMDCSAWGSLNTSSLKIILSANQMVDIISVKSGDRTRVVMRRFEFDRELASAEKFRRSTTAGLLRTAASLPWNLDCILELAGAVDEPIFRAALIEKKVRLNMDKKVLKKLKAANLSQESINLLTALADPGKYDIQADGEVTPRPISNRASYSPSNNTIAHAPSSTVYYPGIGYPFNNLYGYGSLLGSILYTAAPAILLPRQSGYSPRIINGRYMPMTPIDTGRDAVLRGSSVPSK
jgi:hypothetical protein